MWERKVGELSIHRAASSPLYCIVQRARRGRLKQLCSREKRLREAEAFCCLTLTLGIKTLFGEMDIFADISS